MVQYRQRTFCREGFQEDILRTNHTSISSFSNTYPQIIKRIAYDDIPPLQKCYPCEKTVTENYEVEQPTIIHNFLITLFTPYKGKNP